MSNSIGSMIEKSFKDPDAFLAKARAKRAAEESRMALVSESIPDEPEVTEVEVVVPSDSIGSMVESAFRDPHAFLAKARAKRESEIQTSISAPVTHESVRLVIETAAGKIDISDQFDVIQTEETDEESIAKLINKDLPMQPKSVKKNKH